MNQWTEENYTIIIHNIFHVTGYKIFSHFMKRKGGCWGVELHRTIADWCGWAYITMEFAPLSIVL